MVFPASRSPHRTRTLANKVGGIALATGLRRRGEQYFNRLWYDKTEQISPNLALKFLSQFYTLVSRHRFKSRQLYGNNKPRFTSALVVVIGNITVGGVGKTPLIIALTKALQDSGLKVGIVSRGYGGTHTRSNPNARYVTADDDPSEVGDEPLLIAQQVSCPLAIARRRNAAIELLDKKDRPDVILSDDGLQHYAMGRDMEFLVIDGERGLGNRQLLPAGPLREPIERIRFVDALVLNGTPAPAVVDSLDKFAVPKFSVTMQANQFRPVNAAARQYAAGNDPLNQLPESVRAAGRIFIMAGIGNPQRFFEQCRVLLARQGVSADAHGCRDSDENGQFVEIALDDHHSYTKNELVKITSTTGPAGTTDCKPGDQVILVTEKDAVKLAVIGDTLETPIYAVGLKVELDGAIANSIVERFQQRIITA